MTKKTFVTVKYRVAGLHHWPDAENYLRHPHRHEFHFTVWLEVYHDDREVEFIALKEELQAVTRHWLSREDYQGSCEMLADKILDYLELNYPGRERRAWVEEDGENGAVVEVSG